MSAAYMKAIQQHEFGGPEVLQYEDAPVPSISPDEVLIRVRSVGLNPPDWYLREGYKMLPPEWQPPIAFPLILGTDVSGLIEEIGDDVDTFAFGDQVYSMIRFPTGMAGASRAYAEFVSAPASEVALKPSGVDHEHAAGAPMSLLTAWQYLVDVGHAEQNPLQPNRHEPVPLEGRTVLINGAAGGVGHLALQIAKWRGAKVIAAASGKNESFLLELGADEFIDYTKTKPEDVVHDVDLVVDAVGGPESSRFLRTIKRGGALFPIFPLGFAGGEEAMERGVTVSATQVRSSGKQLAELASLLTAGDLRVAIDSMYPLAHARQAHERAALGHIQGKLVLQVGE